MQTTCCLQHTQKYVSQFRPIFLTHVVKIIDPKIFYRHEQQVTVFAYEKFFETTTLREYNVFL